MFAFRIGRKYDEDGNWNNRWSPEADEEYDKRIKCLIEQYNQFSMPEIDTHVSESLITFMNISNYLNTLCFFR